MTGRISLLAFVAASGAVHVLPAMPATGLRTAVLIGAVLISLFAWRFLLAPLPTRLLLPLWAGLLGFAITVARVEHRLSDALAPDNENKVTRVELRIAGLPRLSPDGRQFEADVISSMPEGVPSRILVSWQAPGWAGPYGRADRAPAEFPDLVPGQVWRMALTLKTPVGRRNPHAFDYESYLFAQGIRATGSVRGQPRHLDTQAWASLEIIANRARHHVRAAMQPYLEGKRYGAVLLALSIGDQASVEPDDWQVFNRTGITHLVSISGSHITMIAAMGGMLVFWMWRRMRWRGRYLAERMPAQVAASLGALLIAWLYCLLAGWGVPARRTFFMLAVLAMAYVLRMPLSASRLLIVVAFVVVLLDPWSLLASGFWLSFGAVGVLLASSGWWGQPVGVEQPTRVKSLKRFLMQAAHLQLAITVALMPVLALIFHEVSLASPLANAYAIPLISLVVTPLSLLLAATALIPVLSPVALCLAWVGHATLDAMMAPTAWLAGWRAASFTVAAAPLALTLVALAGIVLAAMPYGLPGRRMAWLLIVPALAWRSPKPPEGGWTLHALDVGQGGAIVIQTARHALLFDAGLRSSAVSDAGERIVRPFLRAHGIGRLDVLVVSHADIDHAGGVRSVLEGVPVEQSFSSFDLQAYLRRESRLLGRPGDMPPLPLAVSPCRYGLAWQIDGVSFEFLWPFASWEDAPAETSSKERNDQSCVLRMRGQYHSALLPADIGAGPEAELVARELGPIDVVLAAHHGSRTSSSASFVEHVGAAHAIAQMGPWNRYGHPHPAVEARWEQNGARFWRSDRHGAVRVVSRAGGLEVHGLRQMARRYWQAY